jgi:VWFA-related protein
MVMRITAAVLLIAISVSLSAGAEAPALRIAQPHTRRAEASASADQASADQAPAAQNRTPTFTAGIDLVRTDAIVRDARGQFVADLKANEFEVYEDGVKQEIVSLTMIHGGREFNVLSPPAPARDGLILPPNRPRSDTAGRIFVIILDDFHLDSTMGIKTRQLLGQMLRELIHDGDMFGIVSTGYSSISEQLTYNRQVLESAITKVSGNALKPKEIIESAQGSQGPIELRHRAHVAFSLAYEQMRNLEKVQNRRKAVIYISSGYDFNPFAQSRLEEQALRSRVDAADLQNDPFYRTQQSSQMLAEADLVRELAELTRAANRANATIYTIDPRGLVAGPDVDVDIRTPEWNAHVRTSQDSLRVIAEETGGFALVNTNNFSDGFKRIDAETSDYYVLAYSASNADPLKRVRRIEVRTTRKGATVFHRTSYTRAPGR